MISTKAGSNAETAAHEVAEAHAELRVPASMSRRRWPSSHPNAALTAPWRVASKAPRDAATHPPINESRRTTASSPHH